MYSNGHNARFEVLIHKVKFISKSSFYLFLIVVRLQIDGVPEPDRLDRSLIIQQQVTVMLHEYAIQDALIKYIFRIFLINQYRTIVRL